MNLIKKIVACGLALTVAFGGICATAAELRTKGQNPGGISPKAQKGIIGGTCATGGIGILALMGYGIWRYNNPKLSVLIVGQDETIMQTLNNALKNNTPNDLTATFLKKSNIHIPPEKNQWDINQCDINQCNINDSNIERLVKKSKVIIAVLKDCSEFDDIREKLENLEIPESIMKGKLVISVMPDNISRMSKPWYPKNGSENWNTFGGCCVTYSVNSDGALEFHGIPPEPTNQSGPVR